MDDELVEEYVCYGYCYCYRPEPIRPDCIAFAVLVLSEDDSVRLFRRMDDWTRMERYCDLFPSPTYTAAFIAANVTEIEEEIAAGHPRYTVAGMERWVQSGGNSMSVIYWEGAFVSLYSPERALESFYDVYVAWPRQQANDRKALP